jgi:hypothetical protein
MINENELLFPLLGFPDNPLDRDPEDYEYEPVDIFLSLDRLTLSEYKPLKSGYYTNLMLINTEGVAQFVKKATRDKTKETFSQKLFAPFGGYIRVSLELSDEVKVFSLDELKKLAIKATKGYLEECDYVAGRELRKAIRKATTFKEMIELFM